MKLELPLRLSRSEPAIGQADAFLLLDERTEALAATSAWFGRKLVPEIFRVRGGFLLIPREPSAHTPPRTIRLHRTGGDLYLPLDAHLHPALLPDEIVALSARQGLIVLPGGTVLGFDPKAPLSIREWLRGPRIRHEKWEPFPQRPTRAEKLTTIERPALPIPLNELLGAGRLTTRNDCWKAALPKVRFPRTFDLLPARCRVDCPRARVSCSRSS